MTIRIPEALRDAEINVSVELPKPKIATNADKDGSLSLSASYDMGEIDKLARNAARALNEEVDSKIIEELLELNGYVKERTCKYIWDKRDRVWKCSECGGPEPSSDRVNYCCDCGAKVVGNVE